MNALRALDRTLTAAGLRAERVGQGCSWRLGRSLHRVVVAAHEALLSVRRRADRAAADPATVGAAQAVLPKAIPAPTGHFESVGQVSAQARALVSGTYPLDGIAGMAVERLSWLRDPFPPRAAASRPRFLFHALHGVGELVEAWHACADGRYLERAQDLADRWIAECLYTERSDRVWHDHITAIRAIVLCRLWCACREREALASPFMRRLYAALVRHGDKLAPTPFYRPEHNHGATQAYALLAVGLLLPSHPSARGWVDLARRRLEEHMARNVSAEGFHREQSPSYHFSVLQQFCAAYRLADAHGVAFSEEYRGRLATMVAVGAYLLKPDGTLPALGDTSRTSPVPVTGEELATWPRSVDGYLYSRNAGRRGVAPDTPSILAPEAGYALLRSGWGVREAFTDERFMALRLTTSATAHVHRDVFSFELYGYGADLIVDSGGPGQYPARTHLMSTPAHNTVVVDDSNQAIGPGRVLHWESVPAFDLIDAEHRNYAGVVHRRLLLFVRSRYVLLVDRLDAEKARDYRQRFHLAPGLRALTDGIGIHTVAPAGGPTVRLVPLPPPGTAPALEQEESSVYRSEREVAPSTVVSYRHRAASVTLPVLLVPEPPGRPRPVRVRMQGMPLDTEARLDVEVDGGHDEIVLSPRGRVTIRSAR